MQLRGENMQFYVYKWFVKDTGEVFYIGKGCKVRYRQTKKRNSIFKDIYNNNICENEIIKTFSTEEEAFAYENEQILLYKSIGQCKANLDSGGSGGLHSVWTSEMRANKSIHNPMKDPVQRKRMSQHNPMKNKDVSERVRLTHIKPVIINNVRFESVKSASAHFNVQAGTIIKWCRKGFNYKMQSCYYEGETPKFIPQKRYNLGGCKAIKYKNQVYESSTDIAKELGLHPSTVGKWAKKGFDPQGNSCKYLGDTNVYAYKKSIRGEHNSRIVRVNGIEFESIVKATKYFGVGRTTLQPYFAGRRKSTKYVCEYVNQQPSHGKSDNSTMKGSTTNE